MSSGGTAEAAAAAALVPRLEQQVASLEAREAEWRREIDALRERLSAYQFDEAMRPVSQRLSQTPYSRKALGDAPPPPPPPASASAAASPAAQPDDSGDAGMLSQMIVAEGSGASFGGDPVGGACEEEEGLRAVLDTVARLQDQLAQQQAVLEARREALAQQQRAEVAALEGSLHEVRQRAARSSQMRTDAERANAEVREALAAAEAAASASAAAKAVAEAEAEQAAAQRDALAEEGKRAAAELEEAKAQLAGLRAKAEADRAAWQKETDDATAAFAAKAASLEGAAGAARAAADAAEAAAKEAAKGVAEAEAEASKLRSRAAELEAELEALRAEAEGAKAAAAELEAEVAARRQQLKAAEARCAELEQRGAASEALQRLTAQVEEAEAAVASMQSERDAAVAEAQRVSEQAENAAKDRAAAVQLAEAAKAELAASERRAEALRSELAATSEQCTTLRSELAASELAAKALRSKLSEAENRAAEVKAELAEAGSPHVKSEANASDAASSGRGGGHRAKRLASDEADAAPPRGRARSGGAPPLVTLSGFSTTAEKQAVARQVAELKGKMVTAGVDKFDDACTHMIIPRPEARTVKTVAAALTGKWVLTVDWIRASARAGRFLPEEGYGYRLQHRGLGGRSVFFTPGLSGEGGGAERVRQAKQLVEYGGGQVAAGGDAARADVVVHAAGEAPPRCPRAVFVGSWDQFINWIFPTNWQPPALRASG